MATVTRSKRLLAWFDRARRDLPWRRPSPDPYRVLVSEIMLQQTRVETVLRYYEPFLLRFPTIESLADGPENDVLVHWSGLGYYGRARKLHQAARRIVAGEAFPRTLDELRALPGIGEYTAAAVASIAFGVSTPVVDGNVIRVQSRRLGIRNPWSAAARRSLREAAAELVDPDRPGDSNQAMMELGATICTPRAPRCPECPLRADCVAAESGKPEAYPGPRPRRVSEKVRLLAALVRDSGARVLLVRRPADTTLLAGTWEIPWVRAQAVSSAQAALAARYGGRWTLGESLGEVRHSITHRLLRVELRTALLADGEAVSEGAEARWSVPAELVDLPRSSLVDKLLRRAAGR
jgi:A/G-specific adenine glycosylase